MISFFIQLFCGIVFLGDLNEILMDLLWLLWSSYKDVGMAKAHKKRFQSFNTLFSRFQTKAEKSLLQQHKAQKNSLSIQDKEII